MVGVKRGQLRSPATRRFAHLENFDHAKLLASGERECIAGLDQKTRFFNSRVVVSSRVTLTLPSLANFEARVRVLKIRACHSH